MLYYAQGNAILTSEEILDPSVYDKLTGFFGELNKGGTPESVTLPTGELTVDNVVRTFDSGAAGGPVEWTEIGLGKPLTAMIREVYTGKHPGNWLDKPEDMVLTSAIKSITVLDAKPRALNFLKKKVKKKSRIERPGATEEGTPIIFYSPALLEKSLTLDLTMAFNSFDQEIFDQIGDAFTSAAGIPIFVDKSFYLIAAGMITKLLGKIGEAIFDSTPEFNSSSALDIYLPGKPPLPAGFVLVTSVDVDTVDKNFRTKYKVNESGTVVDIATGKNQYDGDVSYTVISVDGAEQEELKSFTPTAISAAVLSRFFNIKDKPVAIDIVIEALKLYNDINFRKQIDQIDKQMAGLADGDPKKAELQKKKDALKNNILEELLKPKAN